MNEYKYTHPGFNFAAPTEYVKRIGGEEPENQLYRTDFMRDRDRILYCSAFRRLAGKTQIYLTGKDDHRRNRLTHTLEVSQIARTISQALQLNCDLTEAIALGHDLGHTPFGHAGEQILHEIMVPNSSISINKSPMKDNRLMSSEAIKNPLFGFKHNVQSVRVAATLESNYGKEGLNLTNYTLWGILHHSSLKYKEGKVNTTYTDPDYREMYKTYFDTYNGSEAWSFEAFVVGISDEIAQWHHDLEDALRSNAMTGKEVCEVIREYFGSIMNDNDTRILCDLDNEMQIDKKYITNISRILINTLVNRLIECSCHNLQLLWDSCDELPEDKLKFFVNHSWEEADIKEAISFNKKGDKDSNIKEFQQNYPNVISEKIHHSCEVERMNSKGQYIIKKLFQAYYSHPQQLPDNVIIRYMSSLNGNVNISTSSCGIGAIRSEFDKVISDEKIYTLEKKIELMRNISDHIAGMTDHYAIEEYRNLYN